MNEATNITQLHQRLQRCSRPCLVGIGLALLLLIGLIDYLTRCEIMFSAFYLLEVGLAAWFVGRGFGFFMSMLSVLVWVGGDLAAGVHYSTPFVPIWNALILLVVYVIVVLLLTKLRSLHRELEARVEQRTEALTREIAERARNLALGLYPVEPDAEGLMAAFQELAGNITKGTKLPCVFERDAPVLVHDDEVAGHLYRIAQEAVHNAIHHAKPKRIGINLSEQNGHIILRVEDDGIGLPETNLEHPGLGIRIMAHRAATIGGSFAIEPAPGGGTIVTCSIPKSPRHEPVSA